MRNALAASNRKPGFLRPEPAPPLWQVSGGWLPWLSSSSSHVSLLAPHPHVVSWLQTPLVTLVILGKRDRAGHVYPSYLESRHSQGLSVNFCSCLIGQNWVMWPPLASSRTEDTGDPRVTCVLGVSYTSMSLSQRSHLLCTPEAQCDDVAADRMACGNNISRHPVSTAESGWTGGPQSCRTKASRPMEQLNYIWTQTHDFLRHFKVRNLKNDITVWSCLVLKKSNTQNWTNV